MQNLAPASPSNTSGDTVKTGRIALIDVARGIALLAMASYHFGWDLELFGYLDPRTATTGWMKWYARGIAATFLILVGASLFLAHSHKVNWPGFRKRFGMVVAAALAVSTATYFAMGQGFIFFGILHQIAFGSMIGLAFVRLPAIVSILFGAIFLVLPMVFRHSMFDPSWLWWLGLSTTDPASSDYVPVMPWTGMILIGVALANVAHQLGWLKYLAQQGPFKNGPGYWLSFAGRHSLAFYLVHQPMLIASLYLFSLVSPPMIDNSKAYEAACLSNCNATRDLQFCEKFCPCVQSKLEEADKFNDLITGKLDPNSDAIVLGSAAQCTVEAETIGQ